MMALLCSHTPSLTFLFRKPSGPPFRAPLREAAAAEAGLEADEL